MKVLMLLRHAKSSWNDEGLPDHDRPLNKRGKRAAPAVGRWIREHGLVPEHIRSSTALRARATAEAVAKASGYAGEIELVQDLYLAPAGELLRQAQAELPDDLQRVLLVAHNPGMEDLVRVLSGRAERFPTGALAVFELAIGAWSELEPGAPAKLAELVRPKELD